VLPLGPEGPSGNCEFRHTVSGGTVLSQRATALVRSWGCTGLAAGLIMIAGAFRLEVVLGPRLPLQRLVALLAAAVAALGCPIGCIAVRFNALRLRSPQSVGISFVYGIGVCLPA